ncbi:MAG: hypothetical protein ACTSVF_04840 [Candidatus Asgardarchaeia archaeon]
MKRLFVVMMVLMGVVLAQGIVDTLNDICVQLRSLAPIVAFILLVLAGVIYGAGQVLGAEMRSRANAWAQTIAIGAVIGLILVAAAPWVIAVIANATGSEMLPEEFCMP